MQLPVREQALQSVVRYQPQYGKYLRVEFAQLCQRGDYEAQFRRVAAADYEPLLSYLAHLLQASLGKLGYFEYLARVLGEHVALLSKAHALAGAVEELHAQLVLERVNLVADRRLGYPQMLRRAREVQKVGHSYKALELCCVHAASLPGKF